MPESLRLWAISRRMEFRHLPVAGGIYDQHPKLIADWTIFWEVEAVVEKRKADKK